MNRIEENKMNKFCDSLIVFLHGCLITVMLIYAGFISVKIAFYIFVIIYIVVSIIRYIKIIGG